MSLVEKRCTEYEYIILDTPGQIEVFTWSASGAIITETLVSQQYLDCNSQERLNPFILRLLRCQQLSFMSWIQQEVLIRLRLCQTCYMRAAFCIKPNFLLLL